MMQSICRLLAVSVIFALPFAVGADCMGPYPPSMVRAYNQSCARDASMTPFCTCMMDEVQKSIPLADFIEIGNSVGGISGDPRYIKASTKCSPLLTGKQPAGQPDPSKQTSSQPAGSGLASPVH